MILSREYENPDSDPDPNGPEHCATADTKKMLFYSFGPSTLRATVTLNSLKFTTDRRSYEQIGEFL
jgi:hypothetical protein